MTRKEYIYTLAELNYLKLSFDVRLLLDEEYYLGKRDVQNSLYVKDYVIEPQEKKLKISWNNVNNVSYKVQFNSSPTGRFARIKQFFKPYVPLETNAKEHVFESIKTIFDDYTKKENMNMILFTKEQNFDLWSTFTMLGSIYINYFNAFTVEDFISYLSMGEYFKGKDLEDFKKYISEGLVE